MRPVSEADFIFSYKEGFVQDSAGRTTDHRNSHPLGGVPVFNPDTAGKQTASVKFRMLNV